eukprot:5676316-Alexandrium_andersonii.AAC.1
MAPNKPARPFRRQHSQSAQRWLLWLAVCILGRRRRVVCGAHGRALWRGRVRRRNYGHGIHLRAGGLELVLSRICHELFSR